MDYPALKILIETHPTHASVSDADMVIWLNTTQVQNRQTIPSKEILQVSLTYVTEFTAMSDVQRSALLMILTVNGDVPILSGDPEREALELILGTSTKIELATRLTESVARASDFGEVHIGDVQNARVS